MARIATITKKEELAPDGQKVFDAIVQSRGVVGGPWLALLHSPEMAQRTMHLGSYVRFESTLDHKVIEFTALVSARERYCKHEWAAHVNHAQKAGHSDRDDSAWCSKKKGAANLSFGRGANHQLRARDGPHHRVSEPSLSVDLRSLSVRRAWSSSPRPSAITQCSPATLQYFRRLYRGHRG
jgi:hypothetical protein